MLSDKNVLPNHVTEKMIAMKQYLTLVWLCHLTGAELIHVLLPNRYLTHEWLICVSHKSIFAEKGFAIYTLCKKQNPTFKLEWWPGAVLCFSCPALLLREHLNIIRRAPSQLLPYLWQAGAHKRCLEALFVLRIWVFIEAPSCRNSSGLHEPCEFLHPDRPLIQCWFQGSDPQLFAGFIT